MGTGYTQADVDALRTALATGVLEVTYDGPPRRTVVYQSLAAMSAQLARMVAEVQTANGTRHPFRFASFNKGV